MRFRSSLRGVPSAGHRSNAKPSRRGFTLIEVVLVLVVILIVTGISVPYLAGSYRGTRLRTAARTIERMSRYARSMSILREETLTLMIDTTTMEVSIGSERVTSTDGADGELDMDVAKSLDYIDDDGATGNGPNLEKEVHKLLPEGLEVQNFTKDTEDEIYENIDYVRFYANGQCDWFILELEDNRGMSVKLENDPISGRIWTEFVQ